MAKTKSNSNSNSNAKKAPNSANSAKSATPTNSNSSNFLKIAVVDIMSIVNGSQDVMTLRQNHATRSQQLSQWLQLAQNEVNNQSDQQLKEGLLQKYNAELAQKRQVLAQLYQQELSVVDQNISKSIMDEAKKLGYDMVLTKNVVVCGGDDITEEIRKIIK